MFQRILIATGGEAAMRIARTCRRMGIAALGIDGRELDPDEDQELLPEVALQGAQELIEIARKVEAEAIHPGGALPTEQAALARALEGTGLAFIGANAETLSTFADKPRMRALANEAGIPAVPGSDGPVADLEAAHAIARELGYPVAVKPVASAMGVGIACAEDPRDLEDAMRSAATKARERFGDPRIFLEKWLEQPRHIEVCVIADQAGDIIAAGERECSLQLRRNALVCESPSPLLSASYRGDAMREALCESARELAAAFALVGVGTFEFLVDASGRFFFLEANAGLRGHHVVTEMVTGIDLGELQLRITAGEPLPPSAKHLQPSGFAVSARILSEESDEPQLVEFIRVPPAPQGKVRLDSEVRVGSSVPGTGRSLLAVVGAFASIRHQAVLTLDRVLAETHFVPVSTNLELLRLVLNHESFRAGQYDTGFTERVAPR